MTQGTHYSRAYAVHIEEPGGANAIPYEIGILETEFVVPRS